MKFGVTYIDFIAFMCDFMNYMYIQRVDYISPQHSTEFSYANVSC